MFHEIWKGDSQSSENCIGKYWNVYNTQKEHFNEHLQYYY